MFDYMNRDVPYVPDHTTALRVHQRIKPMQSGNNRGRRPIGARRKNYQHIWLTPDGAVKVTESWRMGFVASEVTYYGNGVITVNFPNGAMSGGTLGMISKLLGIELNKRGMRLWVHDVDARVGPKTWGQPQQSVNGSFPLLTNELRLQRDEKDNKLYLLDPVFPTVRRTNRDAARAVRLRYREFSRYLKGLYGLLDNMWTEQRMEEANLPAAMKSEEITAYALSPDPDHHLLVAMYLAKHGANHRRWHYHLTWDERRADALKFFDQQIMAAHADEVYVWEKTMDGKVYKGPIKLAVSRR